MEFARALFELKRQVRDLFAGRTESIGNVTITVSAASTVVSVKGMGATDHITLMPLDSTTATEYGLGTTYVTCAADQFTITHPNNGNARSYRWVRHFGIRS